MFRIAQQQKSLVLIKSQLQLEGINLNAKGSEREQGSLRPQGPHEPRPKLRETLVSERLRPEEEQEAVPSQSNYEAEAPLPRRH